MKSPVQVRSRVSTERMLEAALSAVDEGGLRALTVDNVARRSTTSNGAIYHRFGSRNGLVNAAMDHFLTQLDATIAAEFAAIETLPDHADAIGHLVETWLLTFDANHQRFRAFMVEGQERPELNERGKQSSYAVADRLSAMLMARFNCTRPAAETCFHILLSLGAARALFDPDQIVPNPPTLASLAADVSRALLGVLTTAG